MLNREIYSMNIHKGSEIMPTLHNFLEYIGPYDSLYGYNRSYKLVLLINMLKSIDKQGKVSQRNLYQNIREYYIRKYNEGFKVELDDSDIQREIKNLSLEIVTKIMNSNAYKVISEKGFIKKERINDEEIIRFDESLWKELSSFNKSDLLETLKKKLNLYYKTYVEDDSMNSLRNYFQLIMDRYNNARLHEDFTGHDLGNLLRNEIPSFISELSIINNNRYDVKGTIGAGGWTKTPWIAVLDQNIKATMQEGVYIVYLFSSDMQRVYLTLNQGVTNYKDNHSKSKTVAYLESVAVNISKYFDGDKVNLKNDIILNGTSTADLYEKGTIAYIEYDKDNLPDEQKLISDLKYFIETYKNYADRKVLDESNDKEIVKTNIEDGLNLNSNKEMIHHIKSYIKSKGFTYDDNEVENLYLSIKTKPFVMLAGISGTGKTKIVELFAEAISSTNENGRYKLIPVKPNWSDSSDLLGYKNINGEFQSGPLTRILIKAGREENLDKPFFVCLDEMNLARVEYYFSDLLSILETRKIDESCRVVTNYVIDEDYLENENDIEMYGSLTIPENLYFIGTVNMDETTYPFSKKVLDRANTIEFTHINLELLPSGNEPINTIDGNNEFLKSRFINMKDIVTSDKLYVPKIIEELVEINKLLQIVNLHIGYRVRDEFTMYMLYNKDLNLLDEDDAFDMQLMQKILPRIQGSSRDIYRLLVDLFNKCASVSFNEKDIDLGEKVIKHITENIDDCKYKKSSIKIAHMIRRYEEDGFTSFWVQ